MNNITNLITKLLYETDDEELKDFVLSDPYIHKCLALSQSQSTDMEAIECILKNLMYFIRLYNKAYVNAYNEAYTHLRGSIEEFFDSEIIKNKEEKI